MSTWSHHFPQAKAPFIETGSGASQEPPRPAETHHMRGQSSADSGSWQTLRQHHLIPLHAGPGPAVGNRCGKECQQQAGQGERGFLPRVLGPQILPLPGLDPPLGKLPDSSETKTQVRVLCLKDPRGPQAGPVGLCPAAPTHGALRPCGCQRVPATPQASRLSQMGGGPRRPTVSISSSIHLIIWLYLTGEQEGPPGDCSPPKYWKLPGFQEQRAGTQHAMGRVSETTNPRTLFSR